MTNTNDVAAAGESDQAEELSGVDLARVALLNAREAARVRPIEPVAKRQRPASARARGANGREPVTLGESILGLISERAWETPVAGGGVLNGWARIVPELAPHVQAVRFNAEAGRLDVRPASNA